MTPTEIKALAIEYAKYVNSAYLSTDAEKEANRVLQWLSDTHCIVPKSKVIQEYRNCMSLAENHPKPSERKIAKCVADELKAVFGGETFDFAD